MMMNNSYLKICYSKNDNHNVCNRDLTIGRDILRERPIAHIVEQTNCSNCLISKDAKKLSRCSKCKEVYYCSRECQTADFINHKKECEIAFNLTKEDKKLTKEMRMCFRIANLNSPHIETLKNLSSPSAGDSRVSDIPAVALLTMSLYHNFSSLSEEQRESEREGARGITFFLDVLHKLKTNCFTITDMYQRSIGLGLYTTQSHYFNHSCDPNLLVMFDGAMIVIKSIKNISEGEPLTIGYIDIALSTPKRQAILKDTYLFDCTCARCNKKTDNLADSMKCLNCKGNIILIEEKGEDKIWGKCNSCAEILTAIEFESIRTDQEEKVNKWKSSLTLADGFIALEGFQSRFSKENMQRSHFANDLFNYCIQNQKWTEALRFGEDSVIGYLNNYPVNSPIPYLQCSLLAKISNLLEKDEISKKYLKLALPPLELIFGRNHPIVRELYGILEQVNNSMKSRLKEK